MEPSRTQDIDEALPARGRCLNLKTIRKEPIYYPNTCRDTAFSVVQPVEEGFQPQCLDAKVIRSPSRYTFCLSPQLPWLRLMTYLSARQGDDSSPVLSDKHCASLLPVEYMDTASEDIGAPMATPESAPFTA